MSRSSPHGPGSQVDTEKITQVGTPGVETVVDDVVESGDVVTRRYTYYLPRRVDRDAETNFEVFAGNRETFIKYVAPSDGPTEVVTGDTVTRGPRVTTDKTYVRSDGTTYHDHSVTTTVGTASTSITTTTTPGGSSQHTVVKSNEVQIRSTSPIP